jgi:hypothetical protein
MSALATAKSKGLKLGAEHHPLHIQLQQQRHEHAYIRSIGTAGCSPNWRSSRALAKQAASNPEE